MSAIQESSEKTACDASSAIQPGTPTWVYVTGIGLGAFLLFIGLFVHFGDEGRRNNWSEVTATIIYVQEYQYDGTRTYTPVLSFELNGQQFQVSPLRSSQRRQTVGTSMQIWVNPYNTQQFLGESHWGGLVVGIMGAFLIIGTAAAWIFKWGQKPYREGCTWDTLDCICEMCDEFK